MDNFHPSHKPFPQKEKNKNTPANITTSAHIHQPKYGGWMVHNKTHCNVYEIIWQYHDR